MDFNTYLNQSWNNHADKTNEVMQSFTEGIKLVTDSSHISQLAGLITHVAGEHLGDFHAGSELLTRLENLSINNDETKAALKRSKAILSYTQDQNFSISGYSVSDQVRIASTSASSFLGLNKISNAIEAFKKSLQLGESLEQKDPANRALAIAGNNLASSLEEKPNLSEQEKDLMIIAAKAGRKYWEIAGTWLETERAEYRLSQSYLKAGDYINSIKHANLCLTICEINKAEPLEFFFAYEAIACVEKAMKQPLRSLPQMEKYFASLSEGDKSWCEASLKKFQTA